ncbi:MAG: hypothetical protein N0A16_04475 [Blastocatellia bacterium]|nr:hypothetical protein [Blastocatellia bacterium]MCS7156966.1 hypothetical protein [Blastocatellia bacterium]MCX7752167.1 hypothetical protein [Blastocatellia bacterium]MDW8167659.1 hypothetical protein [Acidobacteriota bacterium]MDW8256258.1 hypothetical protein [Acidobacteriota bacterium]
MRSIKGQPRRTLIGIGGRIGYDLNDQVTLEMVVNVLSPDPKIADGWKTQWLWGAKVGRRFTRVGLFTKARIGALNLDKDFLISPDGAMPVVARLAQGNFAADVGGVFEIYPPHRSRVVVRFEFGDHIVRFGSRTSLSTSGPIQSERFIGHNFQFSLGLGLRF